MKKEKTHYRLRQQQIMCSVHGYESIVTLEVNYIISGLKIRRFNVKNLERKIS